MLIKKVKIVIAYFYSYLYALLRGYKLGCKTITWPGSKLKIHDGGSLSLGANCEVAKGAMVLTYGGNITIGDNCTIQPYSVLYGQGGLVIGNDVRIAAHCVIIPANHGFDDLTIPIYKQELTKQGIIIKNNVWIGAGCRILDGVTVSEGCVIAAGSVLTKSTVENGIYAGVPAKLIKIRE